MTRLGAAFCMLLIALTPLSGEARGSRSSHGWSHGSAGSHSRHTTDNRSYRLPWRAGSGGYWTDGPGALKLRARRRRSAAAKSAFRLDHPCPATGLTTGACPGYVIDHIVALKRGGLDDPSNMQWQTREAAKAKDKVE